ncbi:hypothetical protein DPEC_G00018630 [Dallia pectoralis]|uniref:Uncharacterized protein n=1 Tax=Dallia pectoralis TaxID=75939 RepID=A0ACC2HFS7_DALPE|nr:hypothetical protein DPEC_G00018630 [Dallia pectoralis]
MCQGVFASDDVDYGRTDAVYHTIPTKDADPTQGRYRPVPLSLYAELSTLLSGMLDGGDIKESSSPWAAPVVLIEESLTSLKRAEWYTRLDLASGYLQVEVHPADKEKTAFTRSLGLYQFENAVWTV